MHASIRSAFTAPPGVTEWQATDILYASSPNYSVSTLRQHDSKYPLTYSMYFLRQGFNVQFDPFTWIAKVSRMVQSVSHREEYPLGRGHPFLIWLHSQSNKDEGTTLHLQLNQDRLGQCPVHRANLLENNSMARCNFSVNISSTSLSGLNVSYQCLSRSIF